MHLIHVNNEIATHAINPVTLLIFSISYASFALLRNGAFLCWKYFAYYLCCNRTSYWQSALIVASPQTEYHIWQV
jgi:hypothetical protein